MLNKSNKGISMTSLIVIILVLMLMQKETTLAIIAIVAALGLLGVVMVESISIPQHQAEARGCVGGPAQNGFAFNASNGRCFHP
jgi:hypothetical protein